MGVTITNWDDPPSSQLQVVTVTTQIITHHLVVSKCFVGAPFFDEDELIIIHSAMLGRSAYIIAYIYICMFFCAHFKFILPSLERPFKNSPLELLIINPY